MSNYYHKDCDGDIIIPNNEESYCDRCKEIMYDEDFIKWCDNVMLNMSNDAVVNG